MYSKRHTRKCTMKPATLFAVCLLRLSAGDVTRVDSALFTTSFFNDTIQTYCPDGIFQGNAYNNAINGSQAHCCKTCSTHKNCGLNRNCCFYDDDLHRKEEADSEECMNALLTRTSRVGIQYDMKCKCLTQDCRGFQAAPWGSLFPVFSPGSQTIYCNEPCALCNNDSTVTPFLPYVRSTLSYNQRRISFSDDIKMLLSGEGVRGLDLQFITPAGTDLTNFECGLTVRRCPDMSKTALNAASASERLELEELCGSFNATFIYSTELSRTKYANIFCALCNTIWELKTNCNTLTSEFASLKDGVAFYTLLKGLELNKSKQQVIGMQMRQQVCRTNSSFYNGTSCKPLLCPEGYLWDGSQCQQYISFFGESEINLHVRLTQTHPKNPVTVSALEALEEAAGVEEEVTWLDRCSLQDWGVSVFYRPRENSTTDVEYIVVKLKKDYPYSELNFTNIFRTVRVSLSCKWKVLVNESDILFDVEFDMHTRYDRRYPGRDVYSPSGAISPTGVGDIILLTNPESSTMSLKGLVITELFYCNLVELQPFECHSQGGLAYLHEKNIVIGRGQFLPTLKPAVGTVVRVCEHTWADRPTPAASPGYSPLSYHSIALRKAYGFLLLLHYVW